MLNLSFFVLLKPIFLLKISVIATNATNYDVYITACLIILKGTVRTL